MCDVQWEVKLAFIVGCQHYSYHEKEYKAKETRNVYF